MGTDFIIAEHENTSWYIDLLLDRFGESEIDSHICDWSPLFWREIKDVFRLLSETPYMSGTFIRNYVDGTVEVYSNVLGSLFYSKKELEGWSIITLLNRTLEALQQRYESLPEWEVLELFFNHSHKIKVDLELGFPAAEINNGFIRFRENWKRTAAKPVSKNLNKFHFNYLNFLKKPTEENAQKVVTRNYGILNRCVKGLTANLLMETRFPRLVEVAAND